LSLKAADRAFAIPLSRAYVEILERRRRENFDDHGWALPALRPRRDRDGAHAVGDRPGTGRRGSSANLCPAYHS
jgi:hypothetical protein